MISTPERLGKYLLFAHGGSKVKVRLNFDEIFAKLFGA
jgi:hypothetical protein